MTFNKNAEILRDKTMGNKLMQIPNDDSQNYPLCKLLLAVNELINQNSLKIPKVVKPRNKKTLL